MASTPPPSLSIKRMPQRPPASTALWAHLLRKNTAIPSSQTSTITHTPIAPLDKSGTSMRILLHDTQANFEKFSDRVDKLTNNIGDAKNEIVLVKRLFEEDREKLSVEHVTLINRCQTEIQKSLGTPAQAVKLENLSKELTVTDRRIESLDKRIDVVQMLSQTHSQALQIQTQTLQTLQEQQAQLLAAILPLLPLLQAVPLHIDSACNSIKEALLTSAHTHVPCKPSISELATGPYRKRSLSTLNSDESIPPRKRTRLDDDDDNNNNSDAPSMSRNPGLSASATVSAQLPRKRTRLDDDDNNNNNSDAPSMSRNPGLSASATVSAQLPEPEQDSQLQLSTNNSLLARGYHVKQSALVQQIPRAYSSNIQGKRPSLLCSSPIVPRNTSIAPDPNTNTPRRPLKDILRSVEHPDYPHSRPHHSPSQVQVQRSPSYVQKSFRTPFITPSINIKTESSTTPLALIPIPSRTRTLIDLTRSRSSIPPPGPANPISKSTALDSSALGQIQIDTSTRNDGHTIPSTANSTAKPMSLRNRTIPVPLRNEKRFIPLEDDDDDDDEDDDDDDAF